MSQQEVLLCNCNLWSTVSTDSLVGEDMGVYSIINWKLTTVISEIQRHEHCLTLRKRLKKITQILQ